jgi:hypothetical protein
MVSLEMSIYFTVKRLLIFSGTMIYNFNNEPLLHHQSVFQSDLTLQLI